MNRKQTFFSIVFFLFTVSLCYANAIEVKPKDVPNCENFTERELKIIQKEYVDEGHQPWRSDPVEYAKLFMKCYYPKLDANEMETVPAKIMLKGNNAIVKITYHNKKHTIYLHKAFPSNKESIWVIEKMTIASGAILR